MRRDKLLTTKNMTLCALFAALIAAGAFLKIPLPFVPNTLQFLFVNLSGLLLGRKLGALSVAVYIAVGLVGLPVFANGGGFGYVLQPTFGYILGFLLGTFLAGFLVERRKNPGFKTYLTAGLIDMAVVYVLGMAYYYTVANFYIGSDFGVRELVLYCFLTTAPGDAVICAVSAVIAKRLRPHLLGRGSLGPPAGPA